MRFIFLSVRLGAKSAHIAVMNYTYIVCKLPPNHSLLADCTIASSLSVRVRTGKL